MRNLVDNFKHQGLRKLLLDSLREKGIDDEAVLQAMNAVPRHYFLDEAFLNFAYADKAFQIGSGQTISQPYTVAFQSSLLNIKRWDKVLEIGTGSGYQTAVLHKLGAKVFSIERQKELYLKTKELLPKLNVLAKLFYGDGYKGLPSFAPFDKILITCGAPFVPQELLNQLKVGGVLVIPVGGDKKQIMQRIIKISDEEYETENFGEFSFVPFLSDKE